uniref:Uncharacterized protein n=1 Tax=Anopheles funestus TaxID=62324 RepID=A0A182S345_ANOFN
MEEIFSGFFSHFITRKIVFTFSVSE